MEKSLKYYPSAFCALGILCIFFITFLISGCNDYESIPIKNFTSEEKIILSEQLLNRIRFSNQGSVADQLLIEEVKNYNVEKATLFRAMGLPYLRRGMAADLYPHWEKMVQADSAEWQGYRGYYYLYQFRDYERAIADFDDADARTPNFVDYPNTISIDYMRAICYERLKQPIKALEYIDKHLATERKTVGENYIYTVAFILKGLAHEQLNQFQEARDIYEKGIEVHPKNADLKYYYGKLLLKLGERDKAAQILAECSVQFKKQEFNTSYSTEEFYQIYIEDIEEAEMAAVGE